MTTQQAAPLSIDAILGLGPVVPVIVHDDPLTAAPLAQALILGGVRVLEVTLRTPKALEVLARMAEQPGAVPGAGTVLTAAQWAQARQAGARFVVSPGLTPELLEAAADFPDCPMLPGVVTPSEVMRAREAGLRHLKLFPAEPMRARELLPAYASVFGDVRFCPTGGIHPGIAPEYLVLPNVACVGGSWLTPKAAVAAGDWAAITALAQATLTLRG